MLGFLSVSSICTERELALSEFHDHTCPTRFHPPRTLVYLADEPIARRIHE